MSFSIGFISDREENFSDEAVGTIRIGEFEERFISSLDLWSIEDYRLHWSEALRVVLSNETAKSSLLTNYQDPKTWAHSEWWPMFRAGRIVYFQNQIILYDHLDGPFDVDRIFSYIGERNTVSTEGPISEWAIDIEALENFLVTLRP